MAHPGEHYVLLQRQPFGTLTKGFEAIDVRCEGVHALRFQVPALVTELWSGLLELLQITCSKSLKVWPAGLAPAKWDEAGYAEWLVGDEVVLGVEMDHDSTFVDFKFDFAAKQTLTINNHSQARAAFVSLGTLALGLHNVSVVARGSATGNEEIQGFLKINIRSRQLTRIGQSPQQAISLSCFPVDPTLEELWDNRVELRVAGPAGRAVRVSAAFFQRKTRVPIYKKKFSGYVLPLEPNAWRAGFQAQLRKDTQAEEHYDATDSCEVEFDAGELGQILFRTEREFTPLRWLYELGSDSFTARLIDDGDLPNVAIRFRSFSNPMVALEYSYDNALRGIDIKFPGGLFVAECGEAFASAVVVPRRKLQLPDLSISPAIELIRHDAASIQAAFRVISEWEKARFKGSSLGVAHQEKVVKVLFGALFGAIAGERWHKLELSILAGSTSALNEMKVLVSDHRSEKSLGPAVMHEIDKFSSCEAEARVELLARLAKAYLPALAESAAVSEEGVEILCDIALRAASSAIALFAQFPSEARDKIKQLIAMPALARAARLTVLAVDRSLTEKRGANASNYAGWSW
ncbi:MAG: hypothetical protein M3Y27_15815 [Acidobacteriota bacterium]|nr:hypothetical protein [Acidobacteriota bacterium]